MKRLLLLALVLSFFGVSMRAQERRHEVNAFLGGYKSEFLLVDNENGQHYNMLFDDLNTNLHNGDLYDLYEPHYSLESGPVLTISYNYIINKWLRVGAQSNFGTLAGKFWYELGNKPAEKFDEMMFSALPQVKVCIPGASHFRLYAKAAVGIQFTVGDLLSTASPVGFAWDLVPIAAEWGGQRFYGNAELCWGSIIRGGRIGFGFRF